MPSNSKGYTLIELVVVMILLGLVFSITAPRFRDALLTDNLKSATRKLAGRIAEIKTDAMREQVNMVLVFDLSANMYWYGTMDMTGEGREDFRDKNATHLPDGVRIADISFSRNEKILSGEVSIRFNRKGYVRQTAIHLESDDGREFTILLRTFLPGVKVVEKYIEFEDLS